MGPWAVFWPPTTCFPHPRLSHRTPGPPGAQKPHGLRAKPLSQVAVLVFPKCPGHTTLGYLPRWSSCNALPHCLEALRNGIPAMHCFSALGQWAVHFLQCSAILPGGRWQWNSCNALPHCPGAVGMPGSSGQWYSCNALPLILGNMESYNLPNSQNTQSSLLSTNTFFLCQIPVVSHRRGTSQCKNAIQVVQKTVDLGSLCLHTARVLPPVTQWWHLACLSVLSLHFRSIS